MARYDDPWLIYILMSIIGLIYIVEVHARRSSDNLTACQHLRRIESRRAKALLDHGTRIRIPRCNKLGEFESIQCMNETTGTNCWCVDAYGIEVPGTRHQNKGSVNCSEPSYCPESTCRMFCPSGFVRDPKTGCSICRCRDPCDGIECPGGQTCHQQEVQCRNEPCPPVPTCKRARSFANYCPSGMPLSIEGTIRPYLCGVDLGKPQCPPLYECLVESGNDYGVCCPNSLKYKKPGICPNSGNTQHTDQIVYICGTPCSHDLECKQLEKCCYTKGCQKTCQQPVNMTTCHQSRLLSEILAVNEREGRGYVPECKEPEGMFSPKQCSRNGLVCWCVDPKTGHKIKGTMGAAKMVNCDGIENMIARSLGRSLNDANQCDTNICAAVCEYGFRNDHNGCPTCECSQPCEGFICPMGSHCEVARDPLCSSGSALCASVPVCKPDLVYSNPCDIGSPLTDNITGEVYYCIDEERQTRGFKFITSFYDEESKEGRAMSNRITCPKNYKCTKLHKESAKVCCPQPEEYVQVQVQKENRQQTMCEYLHDFSDRMEGTEEGMQLAIPPPKCLKDGSYEPIQCTSKKIRVTKMEQRKILEENTIRQMRMLFNSRQKRETQNLKLYRLDESALNIKVAEPIVASGRNAKVIDVTSKRQQSLTQLFEADFERFPSANPKLIVDNEMVEIEVKECWCVDGFGTEIPESRGFNVSYDDCVRLRKSIDCLDITCRMGCEYGFILDPKTKCPACQCRDPCDGVECGANKECRVVDVSCDDEYCPPVPACLPRKTGQCPFLVPPGSENSDANACDYECRTDAHCDGSKRCCSNGCGTQCVEPQLKTACQHLQTIQMHQASELGIPAKQTYIVQCDEDTGSWKPVQCGPDNICWCVDEQGQEISGTRIQSRRPICKHNSAFECPYAKCSLCENGYKMDARGCQTCECRNLCDEISCSGYEECQLINVECVGRPCPKMPICVPKRETVCPEGNPLKVGNVEVSCGPQSENENCPTTHVCQLNPVSNRGVCCSKTRDVCFESIEINCLAKSTNEVNTTKWRFSPKFNKCMPVVIKIFEGVCQTKNIFDSELACNSVCPILTQCERLKLKNSLAAKRTGQLSILFQPRCDPITGHWSPIQCLGKQSFIDESKTENGISRAFALSESERNLPNGVCWCADKKGAPLKGTLTRDLEPLCNHRQARRRMQAVEDAGDPLMEELIRQMTLLVDVNENEMLEEADGVTNLPMLDEVTITENIMEIANSIFDSQSSVESTKQLIKTTTRCKALSKNVLYYACNDDGGFLPTQCNVDQCWCVDEAGNQLPSTNIFRIGTKKCVYTPVESVVIELHLLNESKTSIKNLYDILKVELHNLLGHSLDNLRVHENVDGSVVVRFEIHDDHKVDTAFTIEEMVKRNNLILGNGKFRPDITQSRFTHLSQQLPIAEASTTSSENTLQTAVFILATSSAFLISIFVVFVMLKRGKRKVITAYPQNRILGHGDKYIDYSSPIFVLSANDVEKPKVDERL